MVTCPISSFTDDTCFQFSCIGGKRQKMLAVYLLSLELSRVGGPAVPINVQALVATAAELQSLSPERQTAAMLGIYARNAAAAGATVPSTVIGMLEAASEFQGIPEDTLDRLMLVLSCKLGKHTGT